MNSSKSVSQSPTPSNPENTPDRTFHTESMSPKTLHCVNMLLVGNYFSKLTLEYEKNSCQDASHEEKSHTTLFWCYYHASNRIFGCSSIIRLDNEHSPHDDIPFCSNFFPIQSPIERNWHSSRAYTSFLVKLPSPARVWRDYFLQQLFKLQLLLFTLLHRIFKATRE